jgi:hypothetical protein
MKFFLFIGNFLPDGAVSKLRTSGVDYVQKKLESKPSNWQTILGVLENPDLRGTMVKLTGRNFRQFDDPAYANVGEALLVALGPSRHVVFIHEAVIVGEEPIEVPPAPEGVSGEEWHHYWSNTVDPFPPVPEEVRARVLERLERHGVNILPYQTNAELSVMAQDFVDEFAQNLLFRVYVPKGRLYSTEADRLLAMFREWLTQVKKERVRQGGYTTPSGQIYELYGEGLSGGELSSEFDDFSSFLDLCIEQPTAAEAALGELGVEQTASSQIVARYAREARRLTLDLKHSRETRVLAIKQQLEAELLDLTEPSQWTLIEQALEAAIPRVRSAAAALTPFVPADPRSLTVNVSQQIVQSVSGTVVQNVQGTTSFGPEASDILELIRQFGGSARAELEAALHEAEDVDLPTPLRVRATKRLKLFVVRLGDTAEAAVVAAAQAYIEKKLEL